MARTGTTVRKKMSETIPDKMGATLHNNGCTFRLWAPHADNVQVKVWNEAGSFNVHDMHKDSASGYGNMCWSVFVPSVKEYTEYLFKITKKIEAPGRKQGPPYVTFERIDPFGQCINYPNWTEANRDDSVFRSVVTNKSYSWYENYTPPKWEEMVLYQLHIGTFYNRNIMGPANIRSIISQLDYLKNELGINAIQLLPFTEFSSEYSLGYNSMLPYAVEKDYGTPYDVKDLINACHKKGIAVFLDVIYNHIDVKGDAETPKPYSLAVYDGWRTPQKPDGIYFYGGDEINTPWGSPRPDYQQPEVKQYLIDNALMWMEEYRVDGLRFDSTKCIRRRQNDTASGSCNGSDIGDYRHNYGWELMQTINQEIAGKYYGKITIAEDLDHNEWITRETEVGGAGFTAQWDTALKTNLRDALTKATDSEIHIEALVNAMQYSIGGDARKRVIYMESHDEAKSKRMPDLIFPGDAEGWYARKKSMLGFGILMTTPGIPMIFQGSEFMAWQHWWDNNPIDWDQKQRHPRYLLYCKDMINLRTNATDHTIGLCGTHIEISQANASTKVLVYNRYHKDFGNKVVVIVANFSCRAYTDYTIGFPFAGHWNVRLNSDANVYSDRNDFGSVHCYHTVACDGTWDNQPYHGNIAIGPYSIIILTQ